MTQTEIIFGVLVDRLPPGGSARVTVGGAELKYKVHNPTPFGIEKGWAVTAVRDGGRYNLQAAEYK